MLQPLSTYGYRETEYMKPINHNYEVTISSNDHIITIEDGGDLLACLGLELVNHTLSLIGKDGEAFASVDLPQATGIENIEYDKATHSLIITVKHADGSSVPYTLDISDLVDVYQSGNGIEISEDEDGNKTINVKINEENADILSADENGLAIDLSHYAKICAIKSLDCELHDEIERAKSQEELIASNLSILNNNVVESINNINSNIGTIVGELNAKIDSESNRAKTIEKELSNRIDEINVDNFATKAELKVTNDTLEKTNENLVTLNNNVVTIANTLNQNLANEINRALNEEVKLQGQINEIVNKNTIQDKLITENANEIQVVKNDIEGIASSIDEINKVNTEQWTAIDNERQTRESVESKLWAGIRNEQQIRESVETQLWSAITSNTNQINEINTTITDIHEVNTQQWSVITSNTNNINEINSAITEIYKVDAQQWDIINNKVDKEEGKGLSSNDFTDAYKQELDDLDVNEIYGYIDNADAEINSKIDAVSASNETKVDQEAYNAKMSEMGQEMARIEGLIPSIDGLASEEWVENKGYLSQDDLTDYSTTDEIKDICVTEKEYATYEKDLLDNIRNEYAKKTDIPSIDGLASEEWVENKGYLTQDDLTDYSTSQQISEAFATKEELKNGLAVKINSTQAEEIAKEYTDNKLTAYTPTTGISAMIDDAVAESKTEAVIESKEYSDSLLIEAKNYTDNAIDTLRSTTQESIAENANELKILSTCNDGKVYNETKAMQGGTSNGVVDGLYRLVHLMLKDIDENDLSKLNTALKELIK